MTELALQLIEENKRTQDPFLDLGNCGLENELPNELLDCVWLKRLNLGTRYYNPEQKEWINSKNNNGFNRFNGAELTILQNLPQLQCLYLHGHYVYQIRDVSFLSNLPQLQSLDLSDNEIRDVSFLSNLPQLQILCLSSNQIRDISFLSNLPQLQTLHMGDNQIQDYSFLSNLTQLQSLALFNNKIQDIGFLSNLPQLQTLDLSYNRIQDISFLQNLPQLQSLDLRNNEIHDVSFLQKLPQLEYLDLYNNQIHDISFLANLRQLQYLDLSNNQIHDISFLVNLTQLEYLDLYNNQIHDISFLSNLRQLQYLDLYNNQIHDISFLSNLRQLQSLNLYNNQIHDISFLSNLRQLQSLNLYNNQIHDISFLSNLRQLQSLDLSSNQIHDISFLQNLHQLQTLDLSNNQIHDISFLQNLRQLQTLNLSDNEIQDISFLQNLSQLQTLSLSSNQIQDISFLQNLSQLQTLYLSNNQIQDSLESLSQIQFLDLRNNEIQDISFLQNLSQLQTLYIDDNPFETKYSLRLPRFENHLEIIKNILSREKEPRYPIKFPVKIILLGNHGSGKSSLLHFLLKNNLNFKGKSTHVLNIAFYPNKAKLPKAVFYDFGGQDYYHGIYRVFLSIGSIHLLLWDKATNKNEIVLDSAKIPSQNFNLNYWLAQKNYYLNNENKDPVFVIQTHAKENKKPEYHQIPVNELVDNQFYVSLKHSFNPVRNQQALKYLQSCLDELIESIQNERERQEPQWYINFYEYILSKTAQQSTTLQDLLPMYTPADKKGKKRLQSLRVELEQFHNQGLVLYYQSINKNKVWLNPASVVQHIHSTVLKKELVTKFKGIVPKKEFQGVDDELLKLLKEQKVIFEHEGREYIIPNFLPLVKDNQAEYDLFTFGLIDPTFTLRFKNFLPLGLINQMVCFFGRQPDYKKFWRDQLLFTLGGKHKILINLNFELLEIKVFISSIAINKIEKDLLTHYLFYVIIAMYWDFKPVDYNEFSPRESRGIEDSKKEQDLYKELFENKRYIPDDLYISMDTKHWVKFIDLSEQNISERIIMSYYLDGSDIINKSIPVKPFQVFTNKRFSSMKKIFISYSKFDEDYKNELQEHMITLKRENLVEVFDDRQLELADKWDEVLKQKIDECDYFICLVSRSFLNVPYIYEVEMPRAFKEGKKIIPIIIKPCDWTNTPIKDYDDTATNPPKLGQINAHNKGKVIGLNDNYINQNGKSELRAFTEIERDAMWLNVINKIRELIKKDS
ncbi:leucine-rich repeat domain-containing protein [Emticicia sp. 17c]|uniref:leucine-rich repeat domain-containing protein n=1 Tax=Emticicia sp. 17c TaxID=3127704 RepID=UPI00301BB28A